MRKNLNASLTKQDQFGKRGGDGGVALGGSAFAIVTGMANSSGQGKFGASGLAAGTGVGGLALSGKGGAAQAKGGDASDNQVIGEIKISA